MWFMYQLPCNVTYDICHDTRICTFSIRVPIYICEVDCIHIFIILLPLLKCKLHEKTFCFVYCWAPSAENRFCGMTDCWPIFKEKERKKEGMRGKDGGGGVERDQFSFPACGYLGRLMISTKTCFRNVWEKRDLWQIGEIKRYLKWPAGLPHSDN